MSLQTQVREDMKVAMRAKDTHTVTTLRGILSEFTNALVAKKIKPDTPIDDAEARAVIKRAVKQRKDSIAQFEKGGRADLAENERKELALLEGYLPDGVSKDAITKVAQEKIVEMSITDKSKMGLLIGAIMKEFGGEADGNEVKEVVSSLIG